MLPLFLALLSVQGLPHCRTSNASFVPSHLQFLNYLTYSAGNAEEMQNKNLVGFMPLTYDLWYPDKFVVDSGNIDAVVVVDETLEMAAKIAMSDRRTKVAFLAVSAIWPKHLSSSARDALRHAIITR